MSRRTLQAAALLVPAVTLGLWEYVRHSLLDPVLPTGWGNVVSALIVALTTYGFVKAYGNLLTDQIRKTAVLREQSAVMRERHRIARDMHDRVAQTLYYLDVKFDEIEQLITSAQWPAVATTLRPLRQHVRQAANEIGSIIADFKSTEEPEPFVDMVRKVAAGFPQQSEAVVSVTVHGQFDMPPTVAEQLVAVVQEALTNADKHASAGTIHVSVNAVDERLYLTVSDDGRGFNPDVKAAGYGLAIMSERAKLAGGQLRIQSTLGHGTIVTLEAKL